MGRSFEDEVHKDDIWSDTGLGSFGHKLDLTLLTHNLNLHYSSIDYTEKEVIQIFFYWQWHCNNKSINRKLGKKSSYICLYIKSASFISGSCHKELHLSVARWFQTICTFNILLQIVLPEFLIWGCFICSILKCNLQKTNSWQLWNINSDLADWHPTQNKFQIANKIKVMSLAYEWLAG